jgi:ABC-type transporter Mla maintaining outer membrane lipid asymmetry ATPase subunit MlaF
MESDLAVAELMRVRDAAAKARTPAELSHADVLSKRAGTARALVDEIALLLS